MVIKVACCGGQLVHSNHSHTALGDGVEYPERLQVSLSLSPPLPPLSLSKRLSLRLSRSPVPSF